MKATTIKPALSIYINQIVYDQKRLGKDITVLSLGEAFFSLPNFPFDELSYTKGAHYSDSQGIPELRKKISDYYIQNFKAKLNYKNEIIISAGSKILLYLAIKNIIKKNDKVLIFEPYWLSYEEQIKINGGKILSVPINTSIFDINKYIDNKTKLIIINNPNNPSGEYYDKKKINYLLNICNKKNIKIIIDETYNDFVKKKFYSLSSKSNKKNIIIINSLSKNMGLSGWRIGFLISNKKFTYEILKLNQHLITCAPTILQMYVEKNFKDIISSTKPQILNLIDKRKKIEKYLKKNNFNYMKGDTTFYFMINVKHFMKSAYFFAMYLLLKHQISVVPGIAYGKSCKDFIRVSIGSESLERTLSALNIIKSLIQEKKLDNKISNTIIKNYNYEIE